MCAEKSNKASEGTRKQDLGIADGIGVVYSGEMDCEGRHRHSVKLPERR